MSRKSLSARRPTGTCSRPSWPVSPRRRNRSARSCLRSCRSRTRPWRCSAKASQAFEVARELGRGEWPALHDVADRVGRPPTLGGEGRVAVVLGAPLRAISQAERSIVVPPAPLVVGSAVDHLVMQRRVLEPDAHQLYQIVGMEPDGEAAPVHRTVVDIADAEAQQAQPMLAGIAGAE